MRTLVIIPINAIEANTSLFEVKFSLLVLSDRIKLSILFFCALVKRNTFLEKVSFIGLLT